MPFAVEAVTVTIQGDDAVGSAVCVITDEKGAELAREAITARVNHNLRADDPNRRGLKVDARDRLQQLLAEEAAAAATRVLVDALPAAKFDGLDKELTTLVAAKAVEVEAVVAAAKAKLEAVPEVIIKDLGVGLLESKGVLTNG